MAACLLESRGLGVCYPNGVRALHPASFAIGSGEFVALLGPSGAGKSSLLRAMNGLAMASEGEVLLHGERIDRKADNKQ